MESYVPGKKLAVRCGTICSPPPHCSFKSNLSLLESNSIPVTCTVISHLKTLLAWTALPLNVLSICKSLIPFHSLLSYRPGNLLLPLWIKKSTGLLVLIRFCFVERPTALVLYNRQNPEAAHLHRQILLLALIPTWHSTRVSKGCNPSSAATSPPSLPCPAQAWEKQKAGHHYGGKHEETSFACSEMPLVVGRGSWRGKRPFWLPPSSWARQPASMADGRLSVRVSSLTGWRDVSPRLTASEGTECWRKWNRVGSRWKAVPGSPSYVTAPSPSQQWG